jgi:hypothetical protein
LRYRLVENRPANTDSDATCLSGHDGCSFVFG